MIQRMRNGKIKPIPLLIALALLAGLAVETYSRPRPEEAEPYHAAIRAAEADLPMDFGAWRGEDVPVPPAAIELLHPNVILSRRFVNVETGWRVSVLIVHCKDARDIYGHYPPICYPSQGMEQRSAEVFERTVAGQRLRGTEYHFAGRSGGSGGLIVSNLIVMPDGRIAPDMEDVKEQAWDYVRRFYGAAQVQVVFTDPRLTSHEREQIFEEMTRAHMPLIKVIRDGAMQ